MAQLPAARHLNGIDNARVLKIPGYVDVHGTGRLVTNLHEIGAIFGPSGSGKTFATDRFYNRWANDNPDGCTAWVEIPHRPRGNDLLDAWLRALLGSAPDLPARKLFDQIVQTLSEREWLVVLDEADHLGIAGLHDLKRIYDTVNLESKRKLGTPTLALLLVGGPHLPAALSEDEQLHRRVASWCPIEYIEDRDELLEWLNQHHEMFRNSHDETLLLIDHEYAHGRIGRWARVLQLLLNLPGGDAAPRAVDDELAGMVLATAKANIEAA